MAISVAVLTASIVAKFMPEMGFMVRCRIFRARYLGSAKRRKCLSAWVPPTLQRASWVFHMNMYLDTGYMVKEVPRSYRDHEAAYHRAAQEHHACRHRRAAFNLRCR